MLTPIYPTLAEAEAAVAAEVTALTSGQLNTDDSIQAAWIVVGYGASLKKFNPAALRFSPKAAPQFNWGSLIISLLPILQQILSGLLSGGTPTTTGS